MRCTSEVEVPDLLGWWIQQPDRHGRRRARSRTASKPLGLRFAFYGRMSTKEFQDRLSSARWQLDFAEELVDGRGAIVENSSTSAAPVNCPGPSVPRPRGCWPLWPIRIAGSTQSWWASSSGRSTVPSTDSSRRCSRCMACSYGCRSSAAI
jgi:hypothetical protein